MDLQLYKREPEKRREIGLDVVDEANEANAEMSASSGDKISGRDRGSIGIFFFDIFLFIENMENNINDCL